MHEEIAELIRTTVRNTQSFVFGSYLGTQVKNRLPGIDLKMYGGLRRFIAQHCPDEVVWVEKKGGDDVYVHATRLDSIARLPSMIPPRPQTLVENLWRVFTSPGNPRHIIVSLSTGDITGHGGMDEPPGWKSVPKMSVDDHREVARDFLGSVELLDRAELQKILDLQQFWQPWLHAMRFGFGGRYSTQWWNFRNDRILAVFADRLRTLGMPPLTIETATKHLSYARSGGAQSRHFNPDPIRPAPPAPPPSFAPHVTATVAAQSSDVRAASLRQLVHAAIERLDEEQLREIRLPVGAIADGLITRKW